jgi:hypothetical protein
MQPHIPMELTVTGKLMGKPSELKMLFLHQYFLLIQLARDRLIQLKLSRLG